MRSFIALLLLGIAGTLDGSYQALPFYQDWSDSGLITTADRWENVPGMIGLRGDNLTSAVGASPDTILLPGDVTGPVHVVPNQTDPSSLATGGVAEFALPDPVVALQGSGTADAPHLLLHVNLRGKRNLRLSCRIRDIDGSTDNAIQPVAIQYRVGETGRFTMIPGGLVPDATRGPSVAGYDTTLLLVLPDTVEDQPAVQIRWITANAVGSDEWVGIDEIQLQGDPILAVPAAPLPPSFTLLQNFPNPFNGMTVIQFELDRGSDVTLKIHDLAGREIGTVVEGRLGRGKHRGIFDASRLASGLYLYRLTANGRSQARVMTLIR